MSVCMFIAADIPMPEAAPSCDYPVRIDVDAGLIDDGGADDNYVLRRFDAVGSYTDKRFGLRLDWRYTPGRAEQIIRYCRALLRQTDTVEIWRVWETDVWEFSDRPFVHRRRLSADALCVADLQALDRAEILNRPDRMYPDRPSFYCLEISY